MPALPTVVAADRDALLARLSQISREKGIPGFGGRCFCLLYPRWAKYRAPPFFPPPPSFPTHEDVLQKLLRDQPVRSGRTLGGRTVKPAVDGVEFRAELAPHVEPPVADEDRLAELRAVRAEKCSLPAVYVAVMPRLASRLHVGEEAGEGLVVAVEIRVGHLAQDRIIRARST